MSQRIRYKPGMSDPDGSPQYYDEVLKKWVDPSDPDSMKPDAPLAPPPTTSAEPALAVPTESPTPAVADVNVLTGDLMTAPQVRGPDHLTRIEKQSGHATFFSLIMRTMND